jgi:SAM-dependent methyltransferase
VAPFPGYGAGETIANIRSRIFSNEFVRLLDQAIPADARIVEIGCGTGQMSLCLANGNRVMIGADLTRPSLELAADAADRFGIERVLFVETDLRRPGLRQGAFDVVYSSGVLHHTPDPRASFAAIAKLLKPGGIMVLGLYHAIARLPHRFRRVIARMTGFKVIPWDSVLRARVNEPGRRQAWLRDQYKHPEEHLHTPGEVKRWFSENGIRYLRTYPSTLIGAAPLEGAELFMPAEDDWFLERGLTQLGWMRTLSREGGLWVTIGAAGEQSREPGIQP